ncbi:MAG: hypothetical protein KGS61_20135, partial [Verrucomicrobia bacterium]|nr:hypothetical protein [Verrucomicrobiota bacterium]
MIYVLDTDLFVFVVRGRQIVKPRNPREHRHHLAADKILARCRKARTDDDLLGVSALTVAELEFGARHGGRYSEQVAGLHETLAPFEIFAFDG